MKGSMKLSRRVIDLLRCPICGSRLRGDNERFACSNETGAHTFPVVAATPVLINEQTSVFSIADYVDDQIRYYRRRSALEDAVLRWAPSIGWNLKSAENYERFTDMLQSAQNPAVLVIGGGIAGKGMAALLRNPNIEFVETDVQLAPRAQLVCDAHDLPFEDAAFDAVIAQAVLEHVVDPYRCVSEIHRVLKDGGVVYAETPFMQQVHEGRHDFTRFTHLGHRRLFRHFDETASGAVAGPAMVLAWSIRYLLISLGRSHRSTMLLGGLGRAFFWLKYVDKMIIDKPATLDAASGYYFLGRKSLSTVPDRELLQLYRGLQ
jgi:SAM-dependent methyltransferase